MLSSTPAFADPGQPAHRDPEQPRPPDRKRRQRVDLVSGRKRPEKSGVAAIDAADSLQHHDARSGGRGNPGVTDRLQEGQPQHPGSEDQGTVALQVIVGEHSSANCLDYFFETPT